MGSKTGKRTARQEQGPHWGPSPSMKTAEIISAGNTFAGTFLIAFAFIYFAIIEPHFAPKGLSDQQANETLREIDDAKKQLKAELARIRFRHSHIGLNLDVPLSPRTPMATSKSRARDAAQLQKDEEAVLLIHEKMVQLGMAQQTLEKAKLEKKQYSIPLVSISLDEETLLKFFPVLVLVGLTRLLFYRSNLLSSIAYETENFLPLWAAPLPLGKTTLPFWKWVTVNLLGLTVSGTLIFMTLRFTLSYARENFSQLGLVALDTLLILLWASSYLFLIAYAMFQRTANPQIANLEPK